MDKTGIHEAMVVIPIGMDCRGPHQIDPWKCSRIRDEMIRKIANLRADIADQTQDE